MGRRRRPRRGSRSKAATKSSSSTNVTVLAIGVAAFALGIAGGWFPPSFHPEEARLVSVVGGGASDWSDPALLSHLGTLAVWLTGDLRPERMVVLGRVLAATFGAVSVLLVWRVLRDAVSDRNALFGAALVAVSPLLVLHAHYFTPDTLVLALGLGAILCLAHVLRGGATRWAVALGVVVGLAVSAHYGAASLILVCAVSPVVVRPSERRTYRRLGLAAATAGLVFAVVNLALFASPGQIRTGPWLQLRRLATGDHLSVGGWSHWFGFHLFESLRPGLTGPVLVLTGAGIATAIARARALPPTARLVFLYGALTYVVAELSPLKPYPGYVRYMMPILPAVALASGLALQGLDERIRRPSLRWVPPAILALVLVFPTFRSIAMVEAMGDDTRGHADDWVARNAGRVLRELHSSAQPHDFASLAGVDLDAARRGGVTHVSTSSFLYELFARGSRLADQHDYVYARHERYQQLFEYPYQEFAPSGAGFGWANPTVRILDIREPQPPGRP